MVGALEEALEAQERADTLVERILVGDHVTLEAREAGV
jgi:hypothetical protein